MALMTEMPPPSLYGLATLEGEDQTPPESRVENAASLRTIARRMIIDDEPRARERALTRGLLQGNAPYNSQKRRSANQAWQANLNFLEGEAAIDSASVPYYQLFSGVKQYADVKLKPKYFGGDEGATKTASDKASLHFHELHKGWRQFDWHMQNCFREMLRWGYAPLLRDPGGSWKFKSVESRCVMVPKDTDSVVDERLPVLMIVESFTVSELWDKIRDQGAAEAAGWNVKAVKRAIQKAAAGVGDALTPWSAMPWEEWEKRLKNNDLYWSSNGQTIYTYRGLVKEFREGKQKISQFIVSQSPIFDELTKPVETENDDAGFLFRHVDRYDSYDEAITMFFQNTGYGSWHSVRGMAMKGFKHWDASNRLKCKALDSAFQRCSIVLTTETVEAQDNLQVMTFSDRVILPPRTKVAQTGFAGDTEGVMAVDRMLSNHLANNLGVYNQRSIGGRDDGRGEVPTATQIQQQVSKEANLSQGQISITYTSLDLLYDTTWDYVVKSSDPDAVEFRERCKEDGIPLEALKDKLSVTASRQSGYGSQAMHLQNLQQVAPFLPRLPEQGQSAFLDDVIGSSMGVDKIDLFNPKTYIPKEDDSVAATENGTAASGSTPIISSGNDPVRHIQIHLDDVATRMSPIQDQMNNGQDVDPQTLQTAFDYLQIMGPHLEQHLAPLSRDPMRKALAKQFEDQVKQLVAFNGKLRAAIMNAHRQQQLQYEQQQSATQLDAMTQAKLQAQQVNTKIKVDKWQTEKAIKLDKASVSNRLSSFKALHDTTLNDYSEAADIKRKNFAAAAGANQGAENAA